MQMLIRLFFVPIFLLLVNLSAELNDHLKIVDEGASCCSIRNIDFIYMINLDERPEKFALSLQQLEPYGVLPFRFSAVNGWNLSLNAINKLGVKFQAWMEGEHWGTCYLLDDLGKPHHEIVHVIDRTYFCHCMSRGAIGIVLSHLSILKNAYDAGYNTIWVMEDDIEVIKDPKILSARIDQLDRIAGKKGWDILFTDQDTKNQNGQYVPCQSSAWRPNYSPSNTERFQERKNIKRIFRKIGARYGAYSMIVRRSGMEKLLKFYSQNQIFLPYDMDFCLPDDIRMYTVIDDVVSTRINALSDNGGPNYEKESNYGIND